MKVLPPRALWVPFELGRPMGPPGNPDFQQQVLLSALNMVSVHSDQPVIADFQQDDPRATEDSQWQAPLIKQCHSVAEEVAALDKAYQAWFSTGKRTVVGVAKIDISACAIIADQLRFTLPQHPERDVVSPILMARYAVDDLKSFYIEAALANGSPSGTQVYDWFWHQTYLGRELLQLRKEWMKSDDSKLKRLGELFLVPHKWRQ